MLDTKKLKGLLMAPGETFRGSKGDSLGHAFRYFTILLVIWGVLAAIVWVTMGVLAFNDAMIRLGNMGIFGKLLAQNLAQFGGFIAAINLFAVYAIFLVALVGVFIKGFLWHVFVLLFGGKKDIEQTIKTTMYAATPLLLLGWIPVIAIIGFIWYLVLMILGLKEMQEMEISSAVLVVVVPLILLVILAALGSAVIAGLMTGLMGLLPRL